MPRRPTLITINDETRSMSAWADQAGITLATLLYRLKHGKSGEDLIKPGYNAKHARREKAGRLHDELRSRTGKDAYDH